MKHALAIVALLAVASPAQARHWHHHHHRSHHRGQHTYAQHDPRPRAWCGWGLKRFLGLGGAELNLARNWARVGHPTQPKPGAIVVYSHHVGQIVGVTGGGRAIVHSFNDGHRERTRERSIRSAIAFREL